MKANEQYFLKLISTGRIEVDAENGLVYSIVGKRRRVAGTKHNAGYLKVSAGPTRQERYHILNHRLVWLAVHGPVPDGYEINHKNGSKRDNRLDNLELVTRSQNVLHAHYVLGKTFGLFNRDNAAENASHRKLDWNKVRAIRRLYATGKYTQQELADQFGVGHSNVSAVLRNATWREIKEPRATYSP